MLLSIIIPPLGVFWQVGLTGQFWLNVLLTILGYVPGLIHAIYIILTRREVAGLPGPTDLATPPRP